MDAPQSGAPVQQFEADDYLVEQAHKTLLAVHAAQLASANLTAAVTAATPTGAWLSMWDHKSPGFGAGTHMMSVGPINGGHYGPGAEAGSVPALAMHPMSALPLFIANEAFHPSGEHIGLVYVYVCRCCVRCVGRYIYMMQAHVYTCIVLNSEM